MLIRRSEPYCVYPEQIEFGVSVHNQLAKPGGGGQPLGQLTGYQPGSGEHSVRAVADHTIPVASREQISIDA